MLASLQILVVTAVITSLIYSALPNRWVEVRRVLVLGVSAVVIYSFNPRTLAIVFVVTALAWGLYAIARRHPTRAWIPWLVMLPLVVNAVTEVMLGRNWGDILPFPTGSPSTPMLTSLATLGLSFYSFKLYASIKEGVHDGALPFRDLLTTTLFFPAFPIGPIDSAKRFNRSALAAEPSARNWVKGAARIGIGAFKIFVLTQWLTTDLPIALGEPTLTTLSTHGFTGPRSAIEYTILAFLSLYLNFSGFTDIAIGMGLLFNLRLSENFRYPLLSTSIQHFWQRWNLTLARFITIYMFKPMLRKTGRPVVSLIVTFTLIGLWHNVSVGYLIWGLGHGLALGLTLWWRNRRSGPALLPPAVRMVGGLVVTLAFVAFLSALANLSSVNRMRDYVGAFVGL